MIEKIKQLTLVIGDILVLYAALALALVIRYGAIETFLIDAHIGPFSIVFLVWIVLFYSVGLYDIRNLKNSLSFLRQYAAALVAGVFVAIALFYTIPYFTISPKRNLVIFVILFAFLELLWRWMFNQVIRAPHRGILLVGDSKEMAELAEYLSENPQTGLFVHAHFAPHDANAIREHIATQHPDLIIFDTAIENEQLLTQTYYELFQDTEVMDTTTAYHTILKKIPLRELDQIWIMTRASKQRRAYKLIKTVFDYVFASVLILIFSPLMLLAGLAVLCSSRGPMLYTQTRVGKSGYRFTILKFRTMRVDAEKNGAQWATGTTDPRITKVGRILRFTHIDELPQLFNILMGDVSLVGPRPERPEFVAQLKEQIPYYELRLLVKPGITGWAQVNHRADQSIDDARVKLQYDIYYLKERSVVFDILIILKTIKMFLFNY